MSDSSVKISSFVMLFLFSQAGSGLRFGPNHIDLRKFYVKYFSKKDSSRFWFHFIRITIALMIIII